MADAKRPGRPPLTDGEIPARVHVSLPQKTYDRVHSISRREGISTPEVIRRSLARTLEQTDEDDE